MTALQSRILARHASGHEFIEIAGDEYLSKREIARVCKEIRDRLGAKNMAQAAMIAYSAGHITLPDENGIVTSQSMIDREKLTDDQEIV